MDDTLVEVPLHPVVAVLYIHYTQYSIFMHQGNNSRSHVYVKDESGPSAAPSRSLTLQPPITLVRLRQNALTTSIATARS